MDYEALQKFCITKIIHKKNDGRVITYENTQFSEN